MIRALVFVVGVGLAGWGGLYWLELVNAGHDPPVPTTVADVRASYPCAKVPSGSSAQRERHVRLDNVEADLSRVLKSPSDVYSYVPIKDTQDKLYLELWRDDLPPAGPTTVIGHQRHQPAGLLPRELWDQADKGELRVITYQNRSYHAFQRSEAMPYLLGGGAALGLAAILQGLAALGGWKDRRTAARAGAAAEVAPGACTLCAADGPRVPVYIEARKRRWIAPRRSRVTTSSVPVDCCPACSTRLGKLWRVSAVGQMAGVLLIFLFVGGAFAAYRFGWGVAVLAAAVGLFALLQAWINRRYTQALGPLHAQLKQRIGVALWNPLADRIEVGRRFVQPAGAGGSAPRPG